MEAPQPQEESEAERRRRAEEAMEQMLLAQEEAEQELGNDGDDEDNGDFLHEEDMNGGDNNNQEENDDDELPFHRNLLEGNVERKSSFSYIRTSFMVAFALVYYALRTRQQWYLALVFLGSSKWAYIILGNFLVASLVWIFQTSVKVFLNGLRLAEAEGIGDFFRWNITETCIALTMFRSELNVKTMILFLVLVLAKSLHWVADMRESHLRMTEEAVVTSSSDWPKLQWQHLKLLVFMGSLQLMDILAVIQFAEDIIDNGATVSVLFAFEGAILLTSVISNILLWHVHAMDGLFHHWHETADSRSSRHHWIHIWKDHKATLVFAVEVQAQAAKFLFYVTFFAIVMTNYGMPINLFREVYVSFQALKSRLVAFGKYRQLMAKMSTFESPNQEEIDAEPICIICRDEMTIHTSVKLPGCGHIFHKSCLREWLVQQQTCPTCRSDIFAMDARQRRQLNLQDLMREQEQLQEQLHQQQHEHEEEVNEEGSIVPENDSNASGSDFSDGDSTDETEDESIVEEEAQGGTMHQSRLLDRNASLPRGIPGGGNDSSAPSAKAGTRDKRQRAERSPWAAAAAQRGSSNGEAASNLPASSQSVFPAFYRVVQDDGAPVYNDDASNLVSRVVPFGVVLLGQDLSWRYCDGEKRLMLRMPDGWITEQTVERIVAVPLDER
ncbi:unnamed protein product [Cylindrotheca closterium]|uniref:RING-type E3 ubiquitin transferase n=1 Tax=Cylindrotheca closterium TaxID=2856 RepID=A0AAD2JHU6_9STRA|nr:unnamed protein product [Cylindrotheca closterium]